MEVIIIIGQVVIIAVLILNTALTDYKSGRIKKNGNNSISNMGDSNRTDYIRLDGKY
jgi:hypothetical protein